uniref:transcription factor protein isoform X1 n=1 Tax=Ciona intestinalis TaxID=7719 RepID=UPI00089DB6F4|nr:transcription factor protein isoform X1 [Ciona intestinalis]|eukprot:XP_018666948.1 transcription factor protein isoform X1 [Ciona intestinalis]
MKMAPTATTHTVVISPSSKLVPVTMANQARTEVEFVGSPQQIPKYALGLFESNGNGPRKRKRLTHLTTEEKVMRRKLKNRVAAQTARDRKKVRMECLEDNIQKVQQQAKELLDVNMQLLERAEALERENRELRVRLGISSSHDTTVSSKREDVERIKLEFDDLVAQSEQTPDVIAVSLPECILSPDESADEFDHHMDIKRRLCEPRSDVAAKRLCLAKTECASPVPAAGRCQPNVDPLGKSQGQVASTHLTDEATYHEDDILGWLEQIGDELKSEERECNKVTDSPGPEQKYQTPVNGVTTEQLNSIKELISIDHLYSKPREEKSSTEIPLTDAKKPVFRVQLSRSTRSTKLIKQSPLLQVSLGDAVAAKPSALFEEGAKTSAKPAVNIEAFAATKTSSPPLPMLCNIKQELDNSLLLPSLEENKLDFDIFANNLGEIFNSETEDCSASSPHSSSISCSSPDRMSDTSQESLQMNTPSPLTDTFDPFLDIQNYDSSMFNDPFSSELFPQLACGI